MRRECGGCENRGAHQRWCRAVVGYQANLYGEMAEDAERMGDIVGPNNFDAANHLYAASGLMRDMASKRKAEHLARAAVEDGAA